MTIYGVALLAICTLLGAVVGEALGALLGVHANVGGVGIAMLLLLSARVWLVRRSRLDGGIVAGVGFWGAMYIPIVIAMAANQNVAAAIEGGPMAALIAILVVALCFVAVGLLGRWGKETVEPGGSPTHDAITLETDPRA